MNISQEIAYDRWKTVHRYIRILLREGVPHDQLIDEIYDRTGIYLYHRIRSMMPQMGRNADGTLGGPYWMPGPEGCTFRIRNGMYLYFGARFPK